MITSYSNTISVTTDIYPFEFTVKTDNLSTGSSNSDQFQLPLVSSLPLNAVVDWGDGNTDTITIWNQAETLHTYASAGTYTISITGDLSGWRFDNTGDRLKILNIASWGVLNISVGNGFNGCVNLTCSATDAPVISSTSFINYFRNCTNFDGAIGNWDVSSVTTMNALFFGATKFNQNIGSWNVQNVTNFGFTFGNATTFNNGGSSDINNWNIKTTGVVDMTYMFFNATSFNQNIGSWNVSNVNNFSNFMTNKSAANYSAANLDSIYNNWSQLSVQPNLTISFGTIKYNASAQASKDILTNAPNNWTITDGGVI